MGRTSRLLGSLVFLASATAWAGPGGPDGLGVHTEERIFNGMPAEPCAWPTTVLIQNGPSLCTGTLVHPQIVVYAAHCMANGTTVTFGENNGGMTVPCEYSMVNPGYANIPEDQAHDWAFCKLPAPIEGLPVTPVVFGCEASILTPGAEIAIAGFGQTNTMGAGVKHWNMTTLTGVDLTLGTYMLGGDGLPSVCPGDSGGPAFIRYPDDGSWHAFGIASTVTGGCGGFGTHASIPHAVPWIEMESGIDITPCHDVDPDTALIDQAWTPTPQCGQFYSGEPGTGYGTWADGCSGTPFVPLSATCGGPFNDGDETPPTISITSPEDGEEFGEEVEDETGGDECLEQVDVTLDVNDDSGYIKSVTVRVDCDLDVCPFETPALSAEPWFFQGLTFPQGQFTLTGIAEDFSGNIAESDPVGIGVCAPPPPPEGETGGAGSEDGGGKGCGCSTDGDAPANSAWLLLVAGLGFVARRRPRGGCGY